MENVLDIQNLTFSYENKHVLKDVSFAVEKGDVVFIIGPNGVGKTTLFRCIFNFLKNYKGKILIEEKDAKTFNSKQLSKKVAYIPQFGKHVFNFKVIEVLQLGMAHNLSYFKMPGKNEDKLAMEILSSFGIEHLADKGYSQLSGGEQQLVLIARALAGNSKILIMDEPTNNLDYGNQIMILNKINELARDGYTVLISSHNPQFALWYSTKILGLHNGEVCAYGNPQDVLNSKFVKKIYGVDTKIIKDQSSLFFVPENLA